MSWTCDCGETMHGLKIEHCTETGCHQTFTTTKAGDAHRVGPHDGDRRCLTPDEMRNLSKPLERNVRGHWRFASTGATPPQWATDATPSMSVADSGDFQGTSGSQCHSGGPEALIADSGLPTKAMFEMVCRHGCALWFCPKCQADELERAATNAARNYLNHGDAR